jgi:hypothetical protein
MEILLMDSFEVHYTRNTCNMHASSFADEIQLNTSTYMTYTVKLVILKTFDDDEYIVIINT